MSINFSLFEIGRTALNANQLGISVTGQNIANVNTPGYSRQRVNLAENTPQQFGRFAVGTGVSIQGVQSFRDRFIQSRIQTETGIAGRLNAERDALYPVESALQGSENGGLQSALTNFFGAFRDLEANPNSTALRGIVAQKGSNLAAAFQSTRGRLDQIRRGTDAELRNTAESVNNLTPQIAEFNKQIKQIESVGGNASSLIDQRTELINRVSELTGARSTDNLDGTISLTIGEGRALVAGANAFQLEVQSTPPLGLTSISLGGDPAIFDEGKIKGLQNALSFTSGQIDSLDALAASVAARVNAIHSSGTDLDGNPGISFFDDSAPVTAANFAVNFAIINDPRLVVASPLTQPGQTGTVAGEIANLLTDAGNTVGTRTGSFNSIFGSMVSEAGERVRLADDGLTTQGVILSQAIAQRDSVSGVSLDEEAINLMQYQRAFEAAARFLRVADEMTQTILSLAQ
ncbi:MAG: flagellar hook-associated protein FlgK [Pyrinomonadaceae bacterium]|nr:flagellar hook-associated protein FlgK [Pyrinomonadaceae bacterium]